MAALQEAQERLQSSVSSLQVHRLSCMTLNPGNTRISRQPCTPALLCVVYSPQEQEPLFGNTNPTHSLLH